MRQPSYCKNNNLARSNRATAASIERILCRLRPRNAPDPVEVIIERAQILDPGSLHVRCGDRITEREPLVALKWLATLMEILLGALHEFEARRIGKPAPQIDGESMSLPLVNPVQQLQQHVFVTQAVGSAPLLIPYTMFSARSWRVS